ncbi:MAG: hypothetical protein KBT03_06140 [Bacteroidales bacterium]|nr:hypothetical protein [Candidatus Scybalousia scybalohippi]
MFEFTINADTIIGFVALIGALGVIIGLVKNYIHQIDKWNNYDAQINDIKNEQKMQTRVLLAVLDGLHQQGCNGDVTKATNELTDWLNQQSHK